MLLYRVFPYLPSASDGESGHPEYLHKPQGRGRLDNPPEYDCWYLAADASGAVGETFGDLTEWSDDIFRFPALPGARRALGIYDIPDETSVLDLDDARNLLALGLRPTQVIARQRSVTQTWALEVFRQRTTAGARKWHGVLWWSFHRPQWRIYGLWELMPRHLQTEDLDIAHPAVADAARALSKPIR